MAIKGAKMEKKHNFNFEGGDQLRRIGAAWFVSYLFYLQNKDVRYVRN